MHRHFVFFSVGAPFLIDKKRVSCEFPASKSKFGRNEIGFRYNGSIEIDGDDRLLM